MELIQTIIELSPKFKLDQTRIESIPPFFATRAFSILVLNYPPTYQLIHNGACEDIIPRKTSCVRNAQGLRCEALETDGWCNKEGKGRHDARRVHEGASYGPLRARLGIV